MGDVFIGHSRHDHAIQMPGVHIHTCMYIYIHTYIPYIFTHNIYTYIHTNTKPVLVPFSLSGLFFFGAVATWLKDHFATAQKSILCGTVSTWLCVTGVLIHTCTHKCTPVTGVHIHTCTHKCTPVTGVHINTNARLFWRIFFLSGRLFFRQSRQDSAMKFRSKCLVHTLTCVQMCVQMCTCLQTCVQMCTDMCTHVHMWRWHVYRHVYRCARAYIYRRAHSYTYCAWTLHLHHANWTMALSKRTSLMAMHIICICMNVYIYIHIYIYMRMYIYVNI